MPLNNGPTPRTEKYISEERGAVCPKPRAWPISCAATSAKSISLACTLGVIPHKRPEGRGLKAISASINEPFKDTAGCVTASTEEGSRIADQSALDGNQHTKRRSDGFPLVVVCPR